MSVNPSVSLSFLPLGNVVEYYADWSIRMMCLLRSLNCADCLEEEEESSHQPTPKQIAEKKQKDAKAMEAVYRHLSAYALNIIREKKTVKEVWSALKHAYEDKSPANQLHLFDKLLQLKMAENEDVMLHFAKFDSIINELRCSGAQAINDEQFLCCVLLRSMNINYKQAVTAIAMTSKDDLQIETVKANLRTYSLTLTEVKEEKTTEDPSASASAMFVSGQGDNFKFNHGNHQYYRGQKRGNQRGRGNRGTSFRGQGFRGQGFRGQGFRGQGFRGQNFKAKYRVHTPNSNNAMFCTYCNRFNHLEKDCRYKARDQKSPKNSTNPSNQVNMAGEEDSFGFVGLTISGNDKSTITFVIDSGSTVHLINDKSCLSNATCIEPPKRLSLADSKSSLLATDTGKLAIVSNYGIKGTLNQVLYAPEARQNLLSIKRLQEIGISVMFTKNEVFLYKNDKIIASGESENSPLFKIQFKVEQIPSQLVCNVNLSSINEISLIWHKRMGHLSYPFLCKLFNNNMIAGANVKIQNPNCVCETCVFSKHSRKSLAKSKKKSIGPLDIVHSDVWGPYSPTRNNERYFVTFIEGYTHFTFIYLLKHKSEVFKFYKQFEAKILLLLPNAKGIKMLYCDNGGEYVSNEIKEYCKSKGTELHYTIRNTPALNGVAERMNRTLIEKTRALLIESGLPQSFWGCALSTATYLLNRSPTRALKVNKTPYEMLMNKLPDLSVVRIFGCVVYAKKVFAPQLKAQSEKCVLIGYVHNGYRLYNLETKRVIIVRDVIFDERLTYKNLSNQEQIKIDDTEHTSNENESCIFRNDMLLRNRKCNPKNVDEAENIKITNDKINLSNEKEQSPVRRISSRVKKQPNWLKYDYGYYVFITGSEFDDIPLCYTDIASRKDRNHWYAAIREELTSLQKNKAWILVDRPPNRNIIGNRWVFKIKRGENNKLDKFKARLVAKGYSQEYERDYYETFAPVAKMISFRMFISLAIAHGLLLTQLDVKTAFLNGDLTEEIFMEVPEGISCPANKVCKLKRAIYGLKQASRQWYKRLDSFLKRIGFVCSKSDYCVYFLDKGNIELNVYILLYVDDLIIMCKNMANLSNIKNLLFQEFQMTDLGELKYYLGISIQRTNDYISLDQHTYLENVLSRFNMSDCNPISTPLEIKVDVIKLENAPIDLKYEKLCRSLIGSLMYAMLCTRPDICYTISLLSRFQSKPSIELWNILKRVLRYIKGTLQHKLIYTKNVNFDIPAICYVDASYATNDLQAHSTSGVLIKTFNQHTIAWTSRRQPKVALSTMIAEYFALCEATRDVLWLREFLNFLKIKTDKPTIIYEDNASCIAVAKNPVNHKGTRQMKTKYFFVREEIEDGTIIINKISTTDNLADFLTKSLPTDKLIFTLKNIGLSK